MKNLILFLLIFGLTLSFVGCSENPSAPELEKNDQLTVTLSKERSHFEGVCTRVGPGDPGTQVGKMLLKGRTVEWYDYSDDEPLVCGKSMWYINSIVKMNGVEKIWGKAEIFVGVEAGGDVNTAIGKWVLSWHGYVHETENALYIVCDANGQGKEGVVKGMVGYWKYTMDFHPPDMSTFYYATEGYIK